MLKVVEKTEIYNFQKVGFVTPDGNHEPHNLGLILLYPLHHREKGVFTPICSSEIPAFEALRPQFEQSKCTVLHATFDIATKQQEYIRHHLDKKYRNKVLMLSVPKKYRKDLFKEVQASFELETRSWVLLHNNTIVAYGRNPIDVSRNPQALLQMVQGYVNYEIQGHKCLVENL
ncbi:MAG: hypothetical protein WAU24_02565 [Chitinophagaceae bacterium]